MQQKVLSQSEVSAFQKTVLDFYHTAGRHTLPWRTLSGNKTGDPYAITVSEVMLQQTQVSRVIEKYTEFLRVFPTVQALSQASLSEVLTLWSGLGYYRRAKFLHQAAQTVATKLNGEFPHDQAQLVTLPGIGKNTAGAILAYSFDIPVVFIETNIRTVFLHHFFADDSDVPDSVLLPLIEQTLDITSPRVWYWALMDYGSYLKSTTQNPSRKSKHHVVQSTFKGSRREIRGQVLKLLIVGSATLQQCKDSIQNPQLESVLEDLVIEELIHRSGKTYSLGK
jgi:A/G-specific adenine glycosylase